MPWLQIYGADLPKKFWQILRKSKKSCLQSTVGSKTGNEAVTVMWRKHFAALLNSRKNCEKIKYNLAW